MRSLTDHGLLDAVAPAVGGVAGWERLTVRADQLRHILDSDDAIGRRGLLLDLVQRVVVRDDRDRTPGCRARIGSVLGAPRDRRTGCAALPRAGTGPARA